MYMYNIRAHADGFCVRESCCKSCPENKQRLLVTYMAIFDHTLRVSVLTCTNVNVQFVCVNIN